jgi:hypothetical protein
MMQLPAPGQPHFIEPWWLHALLYGLTLAELYFWWWRTYIGPAITRCVRDWRRARPLAETATAPAPELGHHLKFEHTRPAEIIIDSSEPARPPQRERGHYDLNHFNFWDE